MEIKIFLRVLLKRWWIILLTVLITVAITALMTSFQTPIYSTSATYVVSPSPEILNGSNFVNGLSVLGGQPTVASTYATIATSANIKKKASTTLGLNDSQTNSLIVDSRVQNGTNIIEITVEGTDPLLVQTFANEIGASTVDYVDKLSGSGVYEMVILDTASSPGQPIRPNVRLNLVLGLALGLALGIGLALLTGMNEY